MWFQLWAVPVHFLGQGVPKPNSELQKTTDSMSTIICPVAVASATFPSNKRDPPCVKVVAILLRRDGTNKQRTSKVDKTEYIPHCHTSHNPTLGVSFQDSIPSRQSVPARCFRTRERDPKMRESPFVGARERKEGARVERARDRHDLRAKQKDATGSPSSSVAAHDPSLARPGRSGSEFEERLIDLKGLSWTIG